MSDNLKQKTAKGFLWNSIHSFAMKGIQFFLMLFMARLLSPSDYGTVGLIAVFISVSSVFTNAGFTMALVRKKNRTQEDLSTVFIFNVLMSLLCYALIYLIAPYVSVFYKIPILTKVLRVQALSIVISSFSLVQATILNYTMNFKRLAVFSMIHTSLSGVIGIVCALDGLGVWSLVIQSLSQGIIGLFLLWTYSDWHPSLIFSYASFKEMFGFSSNILLTRLIDSIYSNIYPIVIGKYFSPSILGHYSRAEHWASLPSLTIVGILQTVTFASLAKIQDEVEKLREIYRTMIKTTAFVVFPMMLLLSVISEPLIVFTIGSKWLFCSKILQIICFSYMWSPILSLNINLLQVKGRSDLSLRLSIIEKVFAILVLYISLPYGIFTMCTCNIITSIIMLFINTYYTGKIIQITFLRQILDILPSLILSFIMFCCLLIVLNCLNGSFTKILTGLLLGFILYVFPAKLLHLVEYDNLIDLLKNMLHK